MERDDGQDKTSEAEDRRLAEQARRAQNLMPFFESEPDIPYAPLPPKE